MRQGRIMLGAAGIAAIAIAGCGSARSSATKATRSPSGTIISMLVVRQPIGTAIFVRLTIKGRPYIFKVDTGAVRTVVDATVAKALALPDRGAAHSATTLGCKTSAQSVAVSDWKLANVTLPAMTITSAKLVGEKVHGVPISGLLGSDVLSRYGTVTLGFAAKRLILRARAPSDGHTIPMKVQRRKHGGIFVTVQAAIRSKSAGYVIDTGSPTALIEARTATQLGLRAVGKSLTAYGAGGCSTTVTPVRIDHWTAGPVTLPPTIGLSSRSSVIDKFEGKTVVGLIGANVLAAFGEVTIDFADRRMVLGGATG